MLRAIFAALFTFTVCAFAQTSTAISALRLLPNEARKNLARIEGRDGAPWPERWYFLVHDAAQPLGLREYAVAEGELKANRTISQFADELKAADVIGGSSLGFDSDAVASLAARYCVANGARLGSIDYELGKFGTGGGAAWRATVMNEKGDQLGVLIVEAQKGTVERHDGFENAPVEVADIEEKPDSVVPAKPAPKTPTIAVKPVTKPPTTAKPAAVATTTKPAASPTTTKPAATATTTKPATASTTKKPSSPEALLQKPFLATKPATPPKVATPEKPKPPVVVAAPTPKPNALKRFGNSVGGGVKKLFGN